MDKTQSFIDALYSKYCDDNEIVDTIDLPQMDGHQRQCQLIGMEKLQKQLKQLSNLRCIDLSGERIDRAIDSDRGNIENIEPMIRVTTMFLAQNQLKSWKNVAEILAMTPNCQELILSSNPLDPKVDDTEEFEEIRYKFSKIKILVIGNMEYDWPMITDSCRLWPQIEQLSAFKNRVHRIPVVPEFPSLKSLNLSRNPLNDWNEIMKLGQLPMLEKLELSGCRIETILIRNSKAFQSLKYLDLSNNQLNDWKSISELNHLKSLSNLLLKNNPIFDHQPFDYNFNFIISKLRRLSKLDHELITKQMRIDGEKYYLNKIYPEFLRIQQQSSADQQRFMDENPYFNQLIHEYGEPIIAIEQNLTSKEKFQKNFLKINIFNHINDHQQQPQQPKLIQISMKMKVFELKFLVKRLFKMKMNEQIELYVRSLVDQSSNSNPDDDYYCEQMEDRMDVCQYRVDHEHYGIYVEPGNK